MSANAIATCRGKAIVHVHVYVELYMYTVPYAYAQAPTGTVEGLRFTTWHCFRNKDHPGMRWMRGTVVEEQLAIIDVSPGC